MPFTGTSFGGLVFVGRVFFLKTTQSYYRSYSFYVSNKDLTGNLVMLSCLKSRKYIKQH